MSELKNCMISKLSSLFCKCLCFKNQSLRWHLSRYPQTRGCMTQIAYFINDDAGKIVSKRIQIIIILTCLIKNKSTQPHLIFVPLEILVEFFSQTILEAISFYLYNSKLSFIGITIQCHDLIQQK